MPPKLAAPTTKASKGNVKLKIKKKAKLKRQKLQLKGWLKTQSDWDRFNAWAKINAQPRKIPETEPKETVSKPLSQLIKRIRVLSKPNIAFKLKCRKPGVSKAALRAKPSKAIKRLAKFTVHKTIPCREFPIKISKSALKYEATENIIRLSKRKEIESARKAESASQIDTRSAHSLKKFKVTARYLDPPKAEKKEAKLPSVTTIGVVKKALHYEITPWVATLALPSYRYLKDRSDEDAEKWKKQLIEDSETRGRLAMEENEKKEKQSSKEEEKSKEEDEGKRKERLEKKNAWRYKPSPCIDQPLEVKKSALKGKVPPRVEELYKRIFKLMKKAEENEKKACLKDPFKVKKSALSATLPESFLPKTKPLNADKIVPVKRAPPREKDELGRVIFPKSKENKAPEPEPYQVRDCEDFEERKKARNAQKLENKKKKMMNRLVALAYAPSIDPYIDPTGSARQLVARKKVKDLMKQAESEQKPSEGNEIQDNKADEIQVQEEIVKDNEETEGQNPQ